MTVVQRPLVKIALTALAAFCLPIAATARMSKPSSIDAQPTSEERQRFAECHPNLSDPEIKVLRQGPVVYIRAMSKPMCDAGQCLTMIYKTTDKNSCGLNLYGGNKVTIAHWGVFRGGPDQFFPIFLHDDTTEAIIDVSNDPPVLFRYSVKDQ